MPLDRYPTVHLSQRFRFSLLIGFMALTPEMAKAQGAPPPSAVPATIAPSQVTPGVNRQDTFEVPALSPIPSGLIAAPMEAPQGSAGVYITLRDVTIDGGFEELNAAHAVFRSEVTGRSISLASAYVAAGRLEAAYARAGYVLVRVVIPPQKIEKDGILQARIVDGQIEAVDSDGVPVGARAFVRARLAPLIGKPRLKLADLDQRLTIAGNGAGLDLRSALQMGTTPGTSRLVVNGKVTRASVSLSWDNSLPAALGNQLVIANATLNNLAGRGERVTLTAGRSGELSKLATSRNPYSLLGLTVSLPVGNNGLSLEASFLQSRTLQNGGNRFIDSLGRFARFGASLNAALVARRDRGLMVSLGEDTISQRQELPFFKYELNRDKYTSLRLNVSGWRQFANGSYATTEVLFSRGLAGRAEPAVSATPFSQAGARTNYSKLSGRINWHINLDGQLNLNFTARGQVNLGAPLFVSEKLSLAASDGISATTPGGLIMNSGVTFRQELARTISIPTGTKALQANPYVFSAIGFGWTGVARDNPSSFDVQAMGFGARWLVGIGPVQARLATEYGFCLCAAASGVNSQRLNVSIGLGF